MTLLVMAFEEGTVVSFLNKEETLGHGTVWLKTEDRYYVLDSAGYIHSLACREVYEVQE